ncbi:MAG: peptidylprolyl isomerase [Burkholderiales bacterium]|jgi:peptidyl-prolyl cis-trans isomerase SurA|nr:peptidylprolyl isomerase [Burkholderiales bacterium]
MKILLRYSLPILALMAIHLAHAQPSPSANPPAALSSTRPLTLDRVAAVVNEEAITQFDIDAQKRTILMRMREAGVTPPPEKELERQIIERMVTEKAIIQHAKETGIRVDDTMVERAITQVAMENDMTVDQMRAAIEREGLAFSAYRDELHKQITIQRLREREVDQKIVVTDAEIDGYLSMTSAQGEGEPEYLLSHILVSVPDQATPDIIDERLARAQSIKRRIDAGENFAEVAAATSNAQDALNGGSLGWRTMARLPTLYAETVGKMKTETTSDILRSPAGFHILRLYDTRSHDEPTIAEQTRARHILVRISETASEEEARQKIDRARQRIKDGESFDNVARLISEDLSSSKGGDLGWISVGDTVPDFERAMDALKIDEISEPVRSPFGWHIIQVLERRQQDVTDERRRAQARQALRQRKMEEMFDDFVRQIRDSAYVEYKTVDS